MAAASSAALPAIVNDGKMFSVTLPDGAKALLEYTLSKSPDGKTQIMDLTHTYSPPSARGKGIAGKLSDAAFAWARANGYAVKPSCSYIRDTYLPGKKGEAAAFNYDEAADLATAKLA